MKQKKIITAVLLWAASIQVVWSQMIVLHMADNQTFGYTISQLDSISFDEHEWVDLGLPSGTLWAKCNVGANRPEEFGNHYSWGETEPKDEYTWKTYIHCEGSYSAMTKYCTKSGYGFNLFTDNLTELLPTDDAATVNWGKDWQIPSRSQLEELINTEYTVPVWTTFNDVNGLLVTSKANNKSIFLPAANFSSDTSVYDAPNTYGMYWSRTLDQDYPDSARRMDFLSTFMKAGYNGSRCNGLSIRPVRR